MGLAQIPSRLEVSLLDRVLVFSVFLGVFREPRNVKLFNQQFEICFV